MTFVETTLLDKYLLWRSVTVTKHVSVAQQKSDIFQRRLIAQFERGKTWQNTVHVGNVATLQTSGKTLQFIKKNGHLVLLWQNITCSKAWTHRLPTKLSGAEILQYLLADQKF